LIEGASVVTSIDGTATAGADAAMRLLPPD
jgi:hypothetical protein